MDEPATDAAVVYRLRPADPAGHVFIVNCRIQTPDPEGQEVYLPAWIPGSYLVRDYARHVLSMQATAAGGPAAVHKLDKATWRVDPVDGPLLLRAEIYANDLSVRGSFLDNDHAFVNGVCVFPAVRGREGERCVVHLEFPASGEHWSLATTLTRLAGLNDQFGAFAAANYDELIDRPVLMGPLQRVHFEVAGVPHTMAFAGRQDADLERIADDVTTVCASHADFFGGQLPMPSYQFLVTVQSSGYGGLEHCDSSALICSREDLPRAGETGVTDGYRKFLGLVSHEYFHLWNVKRIRPAEFTPYDLERENYTRQLWLFEGITSYYDDLALLRSGLIGHDSYLELLGRTLTRVYRSNGRRRQTLEEASFDAWVKFYRPDENSPNALVSYYSKGAMVALALDLELRLRTEGETSLDTVMRALWEQYGNGHGVPDGGLERLAEELAGQRLEEFFHQALRTTVDPPVGILLAQFGVRLKLRPREGSEDVGGRRGQREDKPLAWLGMETVQQGEQLVVSTVLNDGPAHAAGLSAGDQLLALNGERLDARRLAKALERLALDRDAGVHVFRRDELIELGLRPARAPRDTAYLSLDDAADAATLERRTAWLGA
jgi:predicted metalloprotease with PDZ domain